MEREHISGRAVGIYSRGPVLLTEGYGLANVERSVPVKAETIFQSGSVGKQFVSAAMMMLVEEGKISIDHSITKYFPDAHDTWKPIVIKDLLSRISGLSEYECGDRMAYEGRAIVQSTSKWVCPSGGMCERLKQAVLKTA